MPQLTLAIGLHGPLLDILVGVSRPRADVLTANNHPVPQPVVVQGLIDTGASCTCIDPGILQSLSLSPTGTTSTLTPSTGATPHITNQYDVSILLVHPQSTFAFHSVPIVESHLAAQGIQALIGRDILQQCVLIYNGVMNFYTLNF